MIGESSSTLLGVFVALLVFQQGAAAAAHSTHIFLPAKKGIRPRLVLHIKPAPGGRAIV